MSDFARMQEAWEAALEGEIERSFRLADEAGVSVLDRAMARRKAQEPQGAITDADMEAWADGHKQGYSEGVAEGRKVTKEAVGAAVAGLDYNAKVPR